jgi:UDP-N-acetylglucosamine 2-epimerase (non-hydrolysing)
MKVMTILGTRPEIIRLSRIVPLLDSLCGHVLVHTGQNFDRTLSDVFFDELGLRRPDHHLGIRETSAMAQVGAILAGCGELIERERPDRLLLLGDTNSALSAIAAKRAGVPVFHMEAGNRCFDDRVPEEVNRRVIDHASDVLLPYTERSRANLLREGIPGERVYVTGNPIREVLDHYAGRIGESRILEALSLAPSGYFLATLHRAENVDLDGRLLGFVEAFRRLSSEHGIPVVVSLHPRTRSRLERLGVPSGGGGVRMLEPFGLFDFVRLEQGARCVLSDSGTVQEECCIFRVPNVTLRDVTERPETLEAGSNILSGGDPDSILSSVRTALHGPCEWTPPPEYLASGVSGTVARILLGYRRG